MNIGAFILRWRVVLGALIVAGTVVMAAAGFKIRIGTQFIDLFARGHRNVELTEQYRGFGGHPTVVVMVTVKHGDIFNYATLDKLRVLTREIDWLPGVNHMEIFSLASFRLVHMQAVPGGLLLHPFMYPGVPHTPGQLLALKKSVLANRGTLLHLISADNRSAIVSAEINDENLDYGEFYRQLRGLVLRNQDANHTLYLSGEPVIRSYAYHYLWAIEAVFAAACLIVILIFYLILGAYSCWWVPLLTGLLSACWGLGFGGFMGYTFDPLMLVVPFILTARNLSHGIQWQRRYYSNLNRLEDRTDACVTTAEEMFIPGLVAITADVTGIVFMSFSGIPVLDELARTGTLWLASSLWTVFIFQPILMSYLVVSHERRGELAEGLRRRLEDFGERVLELPVTPGWGRRTLLGGSLMLLGVGAIAAMRVPVGYNMPGTPLYRADTRVNLDWAAIARKFPIDEGWVVVTTPAYPDPQSVLSPRVLRMIDRLQAYLLLDPQVRQVISFGGIVKRLNQKFDYSYPKFVALPNSITLAGNFWAMFRGASAPGEMDDYFSNTMGTDTCIRILLSDHSQQTLARLSRRLARFQRRYVRSDPALSHVRLNFLGGTAGLYAAANDVLYRTHLLNLAMVLACVLVFSSVLFRSLPAGAMFVFSCLLANFTAFIYMRLVGMALTIDTVPVISLAIGLGLDYSIATVSAIRAQVAYGYDLDNAIRVALRNAGESVFCTLLVMMGCLMPWLLSPALFHQHMAALLAVLIATNALAGIFILPSVISASRMRFITRCELSEESAKLSEVTATAS
ncbi:MAG TPA: MMPL family transporter [Candidatus Binataceae bacterium]|nr:MMPL family transporter [Candidatus Binataceae bacterium]